MRKELWRGLVKEACPSTASGCGCGRLFHTRETYIESGDSDHDVSLTLTVNGYFHGREELLRYARQLAKRLNGEDVEI